MPAVSCGLCNYVRPMGGGAAASTLLDDLVSYWKMDEATGSRVDSVGENDLTENGTIGSDTGIKGSAADLDSASSEYLSIASLEWLTAWTVSMWIYIDSYSDSYVGLVSRDDSGSPRNQSTLYVKNNGKLAVYIDTAAPTAASADGTGSQTLSAGAWTHIVWSYSAATGIQTWVDTVADIDTADSVTPSTTAAPFSIGRDEANGVRFFNGRIDEVGIWSRVLTSAERDELYNAGSGVTYPFS